MRARRIVGWLLVAGSCVLTSQSTVLGKEDPNAGFSPKLQANLKLEWVSIPYSPPFWAARIVGMEPTSPLAQGPWGLNLQVGDIITRLDGSRISDGRYFVANASGGYWALPEAERHFGRTQVRYIRTNTFYAQNGYAYLGPPIWPEKLDPVSPWPPSSPAPVTYPGPFVAP